MNFYPSPLGQLSREAVFSPPDEFTTIEEISLQLQRSYERIADNVNQWRGVIISVGDRAVTNDALVSAKVFYNESKAATDPLIKSIEELSGTALQSALEGGARKYGKATTPDEIEKFLYGEVTKKAGAKIDEFTPADARVLVNDITRDFASGYIDFPPHLLDAVKGHIASNLMKDTYVGDDGKLYRDDDYDFPSLSIWPQESITLNNILGNRSHDMEINDGLYLLLGNKVGLAVEIAGNTGVISRDDHATITSYLNGDSLTPEKTQNVETWLGEIEQKLLDTGATGWMNIVVGRERTLPSVLEMELLRNADNDPEDLDPDKRPAINPLGWITNEAAIMEQHAQSADLEALGKKNTSAINETITSFARDINQNVFGSQIHIPNNIRDKDTQTAVKEVNRFYLDEIKDFISKLPDSWTNIAKGEAALAYIERLFIRPDDPRERGELGADLGPVDSIYVADIKLAFDKTEVELATSTDRGRKTFIRDRFSNWEEDFTPEVFADLVNGIDRMTDAEAETWLDDNEDMAKSNSQTQRRLKEIADFGEKEAAAEFDDWFHHQGGDVDDLDPDELENWHDNTWNAGGIEELLIIQRNLLRNSIEDPGIREGGAYAFGEVSFSPDEVATALMTNIAAGNALELAKEDAAARADFRAGTDADRAFKDLMGRLGVPPSEWTKLREHYSPEIAQALQIGAFTLDIQNDIARSIKGVRDSIRESAKLDVISDDFSQFVLGIAQEQGVIKADTSDKFVDRFMSHAIPEIAKSIDRRGLFTSDDIRDLVIGAISTGEQIVIDQETRIRLGFDLEPVEPVDSWPILDPIDISELAFNEFMYAPEEGTPAATFTPEQRLELHDQLEFAKDTGQGVNPLGMVVPWTAAQKTWNEAMGITQDIDTVLSDVAAQYGAGIPMFPAEFAKDMPTPEELSATTTRVRMAKEEELARLDLARAQELLGDDIQPTARQIEDARSERLREAMGEEYREEQSRLRTRQIPATATEFATAIREAAPEDIDFQKFLLGEYKEIGGAFKRTAAAPQDFSEYFVGITPGLRERFGQTPQGVASELMRFEREEREGERLELETEREESEAERERRRSLRGRGRTELRI